MNSLKALALAATLATSGGAHAALVSFTGTGLQIPGADAAGVSVDIHVLDTRLIVASGDNVTLSLFDFEHNAMMALAVTLEHVGSGAGTQTVFDQVLASGGLVSFNGLYGDYAFNSGASTTLRDEVDALDRIGRIPSGTYLPTLADDATASELSSAWNGESVAGVWRLHLADHWSSAESDVGWDWRLDIEVEDAAAVPEPATLPLLLAAAGLAPAWRRYRAQRRQKRRLENTG